MNALPAPRKAARGAAPGGRPPSHDPAAHQAHEALLVLFLVLLALLAFACFQLELRQLAAGWVRQLQGALF